MRNILFILLLSISVFSKGQVTFQKVFGDPYGFEAKSIKATSDKGFALLGNCKGGIIYFDLPLFIAKYDSSYNFIWSKTYSSNQAMYAKDFHETFDGGFIAAANITSDTTFTRFIYILKTDMNGDITWSRSFFYGDTIQDVYSIQQTTDSGYIFTGTGVGIGLGMGNIYTVKLDLNGNVVWSKTYGMPNFIGYSSNDIKQTMDNGYIIVGVHDDNTDSDILLLKIDPYGNVVWVKKYGNPWAHDRGISVQLTYDGGFIIGGNTDASWAGNDLCLLKTDSVGNMIWSKALGIQKYYTYSNIQCRDSGFISVGLADYSVNTTDTTNATVIKTDKDGNFQWTKNYGSSIHFNIGYSISQAPDNGYFIGGMTRWLGVHDVSFAYIIKTDSLGSSGCNERSDTISQPAISFQVDTPLINTFTINTQVEPTTTVLGTKGMEENLCNTLGISKSDEHPTFQISPNPFHSAATLSGNAQFKMHDAQLKIYNTMGALVRIEHISNITSYILHRGDLSDGLYFYELRTTNSELISNGKFVVE